MHQFCLGGRVGDKGEGGGGAQKKKSPDFKSSEVGISASRPNFWKVCQLRL